MSDAADLEIRRRLLFRAWHCGTQETDILLGTFAA
jgi:succinate dehydrogenase flavin-adding protein (antitoxin of CptAB toxin-antitoxin module)